MTTGRGFQLANIDVGILQDPKVIKLAKLIPDEGELACMILVFEQTLFESWRVGKRVTAGEAEIYWEPTEERVAALQKVGLLTDDGRVTESGWATYYMPALQRSEQRREAGRKGGFVSSSKRKRDSGDDSTPLQRRSSPGEASAHLTPADPPSPTGEAGVGPAGLRVVAPAWPPNVPPPPRRVDMNRLDEAETHAIEAMLHDLAPADGRRRRLQAELTARQADDDRAATTPDLTSEAEASFSDLGATWTPSAQSELPA